MTQAQAFSLQDSNDQDVAFPSGNPSVLCFVKEDCPTCNEIMPVLSAFYAAYADKLDFLLIGQTRDGNDTLIQRHGLTMPILDDSALKVSFAYDLDIVPTILLVDPDGEIISEQIGFVKADWQTFNDAVSKLLGVAAVDLDWNALPDWRPGCGSLSADPVIHDRLRAEAENSPLRARRIEIAPQDDEFEFMYDQGFSDGLPTVPPTPERVMRMLSGTRRDPQEVIATVPPNMGDATVEKIAINAVMAGCKPEYLPVVIAALQAACTDEFNIHGVMATTMGASPVMVVNGPIREQLGMNMKLGALGQGNRASNTIGRALRLTVRNVGGARPGGTERSTLGSPLKFTMCFPEWEERHPWDPMHVERGFDRNDSVVTLFAMTSGPALIVDQTSRTASQLAGSFGLCLEAMHHPRSHRAADAILVICPEHVDTLVRGGYSKADIRARIQEVTSRRALELAEDDITSVGIPRDRLDQMDEEAQNRRLPKFASEDNIHIVIAGADAGKFSGAFHGWAGGKIGSVPVSRKIGD
ncbi:MAG: TlpA disulfide reductase family protein [Proteobacteria bacterium]|jgi:peroxiredoxin|nr:TlpA disulfide reductase family protein [Pseudomonadota bacterium]MDA1298815.1 TlpA disulfide reductase family protein [Pseudomonadota bacterium]